VQATQVDERKVFARFEDKTRKSAELFRRAERVTPGGVMAGIKFFEPYPVFMKRAKGSHVWDVDGNEYVDYLLSYGALILGHGAPVVKRAVDSVLRSVGTTVMGAPTGLESEYGARLRDIYHPDGMLRFTNSGLEATLLAARLAKGFTGKKKVAKFEGHYHGAVDHFLFSYSPDLLRAGDPESPAPIADSADIDGGMLDDSVVMPFNNWKGTERILNERSDELACVIMEPFEEGVIPAEEGFMSNLRRVTSDLKIPLIFDEVKTGFRVRLGGATEFYSVTPDLTCLGKIIGGGLPVGAVVGDTEIMKQLDPRSQSQPRVFHSGTFNGNPLSLAAGEATVDEISKKGRFRGLVKRTSELKQLLSGVLRKHGVPHSVAGEGGMFNIYLTEKKVRNYRDIRGSDLRLRRLIDIGLISRGVYLKPENRFCLSLAHTDDDIRQTRQRFDESLDSFITKTER
jgi:glutamate-1-semialdehyde 2,1-aminomutase